MVERIGLEAVLEDDDFKKGLTNYVKSVNGANTKTSKAATSMSKVWSGLGKGVLSFAKLAGGALVAGVGAGITALAGITVASTRTAISFESAFAGVIKTTEGLTDDFGNLTESGKELQQGFRDLAQDVPLAVEELLEIGELGGQLGIARDDLLDFTEAIAAMGVATNLTTEEAATGFAQIANIMGTVESEGSAAFEKLGSSIVALGNNSATTERDILSFAQRIAGAGKIAGLSEADILGIGAAFASVGIESERGGTAVQKVLNNITAELAKGSEKVQDFAQVAGYDSADAFAQAWEKDAAGAFTDFVDGLGTAGTGAITILDDLGLADQRLVGAFLSLAGAGDVLNDSIVLSNKAWEDNDALVREAEQRYATTESQMILFKNSLKDIGITIGSAVLPFLNDMLESAKPLLREFGDKLPDAIEKVVTWLKTNLPKAIKTVSDFWQKTMLPALKEIGTYIQENIVPVLKTLFEWLQDNLPKAIAFITEHWHEFKAALIAIGAVLAGAGIVSAISSIGIAIAALNLPLLLIVGAVGALAAAWAGDWGGMRTAITAWWEETGRPIFKKVVEWLQINIPKAIETVSAWWTETFVPAMRNVWIYIQENIIPIFKAVWGWLSENIPKAIKTASDYWQNTLKPAIMKVWQFITEQLIPTFQEIWDWLSTTIPQAIETAKQKYGELRQNISELWTMLKDNLIAAFQSLISRWDTLKARFEDSGFIDALKGIFETFLTTIKNVLSTLRNIVSTIAQIKSKTVTITIKTIRKTITKDDGGGGSGGGGSSGGGSGGGGTGGGSAGGGGQFLARGGILRGLGVVGEEGPELVSSNTGVRIFPNDTFKKFSEFMRSIGRMGSLNLPTPQPVISSPITTTTTNNNQRAVININGGTNIDEIRLVVEEIINKNMVLNS